MTGDAPQPGETPRTEGNPWSWSDPGTGAWWRGEGPPPPPPDARRADPVTPVLELPAAAEHTGEAAEAHKAGVEDTTAAMAPETAETPKTSAKPVERHHDEVDAERFNAAGTVTAYVPETQPEEKPVEAGEEVTIVEALAAVPDEIQSAAAAVPDVMVLPEPEQNRPTVVLDRSAVPGQGPAGRPRLSPSRADHARADRAIQDRVRAERTSALLETSPFWLTDEQRPAPEATERTPRPPRPPKRRARDPRRPVSGLFALLVLALVATFFSWVSAEPFWLAVGHGREGTASVAGCTGSGVTQRCTGQFTTADGAYTVRPIALFGVEPGLRAAGSTVPARMVSTDSRQAYVGETSILVHLRWSLGFVLVLLCGLGIAGLTGVRRLESARARRAALLLSLAGPLALLAGFLVTAY